MKTAQGLAMFEKMLFGWLPREPVASGLHGTTRPWWWQPSWSLGAFIAEITFLNAIVPVSAFGLPLFVANMWLCFLVGGVSAYLTGKRMGYQPPQESWRGWGHNPRWFVALPIAAELGVGISYFNVSNWVYVFTYCQTGNVCTISQLAPVMLLLLGLVSLALLAFNALLVRSQKAHNLADEPTTELKP